MSHEAKAPRSAKSRHAPKAAHHHKHHPKKHHAEKKKEKKPEEKKKRPEVKRAARNTAKTTRYGEKAAAAPSTAGAVHAAKPAKAAHLPHNGTAHHEQYARVAKTRHMSYKQFKADAGAGATYAEYQTIYGEGGRR